MVYISPATFFLQQFFLIVFFEIALATLLTYSLGFKYVALFLYTFLW